MTDSVSPPSVPPKGPHSLPKLSKKTIALASGGLLLLTVGVWGAQQLLHPTPAPEGAETVAPVAVSTLTIAPHTTPNQIQLSGTVKPLEQAVLSTRVQGRITQLSLEAGDRFRKGEILAQINVTDIAAQTNQARSGVAQAQAELARSQATLSQLQSQQVEVQSALRLAQINQKRMAQLQADGAVAQSSLDEANTRLEEAQARVAQVQAGIHQAQAAIAQSSAAVNQAESGVTAASVNESYGTVIAPFDGVVVQKLAYEGEMTAPGTPLLKVENPDRLQLEIPVPEENLRFVQVGQSVAVQVDAINQSFRASIQQIVPSADPGSRSFLVKIPLHNPGSLISGMFGRVALPSGTQTSITIPEAAVLRRGQLEGVYVVQTSADKTVALLRWIKTGKTQQGQVEIVSGLAQGDRVITSNLALLRDGQPIRVQPSQPL